MELAGLMTGVTYEWRYDRINISNSTVVNILFFFACVIYFLYVIFELLMKDN